MYGWIGRALLLLSTKFLPLRSFHVCNEKDQARPPPPRAYTFRGGRTFLANDVEQQHGEWRPTAAAMPRARNKSTPQMMSSARSALETEHEVAKAEAEEKRERMLDYQAKALADKKMALVKKELKTVSKAASEEHRKLAAQRNAAAERAKKREDEVRACAAELERMHAQVNQMAHDVAFAFAAAECSRVENENNGDRERQEQLRVELAAARAAVHRGMSTTRDDVHAAQEAMVAQALEKQREDAAALAAAREAALQAEHRAVAQAVETAVAGVRAAAAHEQVAAVATAVDEARVNASARAADAVAMARARSAVAAHAQAYAHAEACASAIALAEVTESASLEMIHARKVLHIQLATRKATATARAGARLSSGAVEVLAHASGKLAAAGHARDRVAAQEEGIGAGTSTATPGGSPIVQHAMAAARADVLWAAGLTSAAARIRHDTAVAKISRAAAGRIAELEASLADATEASTIEAARAAATYVTLDDTSDRLEAARAELARIEEQKAQRLTRRLARLPSAVLASVERLRRRGRPRDPGADDHAERERDGTTSRDDVAIEVAGSSGELGKQA